MHCRVIPGERRAQLVGDEAEELVLGAERVPELVDVHGGDDDAVAALGERLRAEQVPAEGAVVAAQPDLALADAL